MQINQLQPGILLAGRYEIVKRIGGGGMGNVYQAKDKRLADAPRAVKEMIGMFTDEASKKKAIEDFERESQLLASLDHSAIPTIFDYFVNEGNYYLVMKLINGGDLAGQLAKAPKKWIDEKTVTNWGIQICDVLAYLHQKEPPIIYRDMKPANVMLDERNRIVLVDFGIARFVAPTQKSVTAIGTMGYAPPELFSGKVEPRSDLYSLGATMFHLLTGRDPQDNPLLIFDFNKNPSPRQLNPKLSEGIEKIISKAVEYKADNRFESAIAMKEALEEHLRWLEHGSTQGQAAKAKSFCAQCGAQMTSGDLFCNSCGAPSIALPSAALSSSSCSVVLRGPDNKPITIPLSKETNSFGRVDTNRGITPDVDLTPHDPQGKVSRRHAVIHAEQGRYFLEDLGSTNGTFLNGDRLAPKEKRPLKSGDNLCMGEVVMKFVIRSVPPNVDLPNKHSSGQMPGGGGGNVPGGRAGFSAAPAENYLITDVEFPEKVRLGQVTQLSIGLASSLSAGGKVIPKVHSYDCEFEYPLELSKDTTINLDAYIAAPGFEVEPEIFTNFNFKKGGNASPALFLLKGVRSGTTKITIDFYHDTNKLGSVSLETEITV